MAEAFYETLLNTSPLGISYAWRTVPGGYRPLHWHNEVELLFPLNGNTDIVIDGKKHVLMKKHVLVIEARRLHSTYTYDTRSMFLRIHLSREKLAAYLPELDTREIRCLPDAIPDEHFEAYLGICGMLEDLTRLYVKGGMTFSLEAEGMILQIFARLIEMFSVPVLPETASLSDGRTRERLKQVITFVEEHYREPLSPADGAELLSVGEEYFCRLFKKNMGMTFLQYVNEIRASHIYSDLVQTDLPIAGIASEHGFTNQKLFNRTFKSIYGCTPSQARRAAALPGEGT